MARLIVLMPLLAAACSDWNLTSRQDEPEGVDDDTDAEDVPVDVDTEDGTDAEVDTEVDPDRFTSCNDAGFWVDQWWGSMPFSYQEPLRDGAGRPFWDPAFELRDFSTVQVPERGQPSPGWDKVYVVRLWLDAPGPQVYLDLQSDDGLEVYLNGDFIGQWGGGWQEEGCVNDDANCTEFVYAPPVEITDDLNVGENVLAVRLSNAIGGAFMGVTPRCVSP